jgi:hypothetical protein
MGFEDHFKIRDNHHGNYPENRYQDAGRYAGPQHNYSYEEGANFNWLNLLDKIRNNNKLKLFIILAGVLVLTIIIVLLIVLLPLIVKLINTISQIGLQGILKEITGFLENILKGTKN